MAAPNLLRIVVQVSDFGEVELPPAYAGGVAEEALRNWVYGLR